MSIEAPLIGEKLLSNAWPVKVALGEEDAPGSIAAGAKLGSAHCRLRAAGCAIRGYESVGTRLECRFLPGKGSESRGDRRDVMFDCSGWQKGHRAAIQCLAMDEPFLIGADDGL